MLAVIIDIEESKVADVERRKVINEIIKKTGESVYKKFRENFESKPALTQGDSLELLVNNPKPLMYIFHKILFEGIKFKVGIGVGDVYLKQEYADECDGPAFWYAREAIDEIKRVKNMRPMALIKKGEDSNLKEVHMALIATLYLTSIISLSKQQIRYCFKHIWEEKSIKEIAKEVNFSTSNISKTLKRTPCYTLKKIVKNL